MPISNPRLEEALARVSNANVALRLSLQENHDLLKEAVTLLEIGQPLTEMLRKLPVRSSETAANEAANELFRARLNLRKVTVCAALEDGMSVEELAHMFDVTPDMVMTFSLEQSNRPSVIGATPTGQSAGPEPSNA